jgi:hypothetical protein
LEFNEQEFPPEKEENGNLVSEREPSPWPICEYVFLPPPRLAAPLSQPAGRIISVQEPHSALFILFCKIMGRKGSGVRQKEQCVSRNCASEYNVISQHPVALVYGLI